MTIYKKIMVFSIIGLIIFIYIITSFADFSRLLSPYAYYSTFPKEIIKRLIVLLSAALVWLGGKDCLNSQDNQRMKAVFIFISLGEVCFLISKPIIAIFFFAICQCLLITRHCRGMFGKLTTADQRQKRKLALAALGLASLLFIGAAMLYPIINLSSLVLMGIGYGIILCISLWVGLANFVLGLFPLPNSRMIALGMLCFFCCDILVGMDGLLGYSTAWILTSSFIWVFYAPAITLLALSSYSYSSKAYSSAMIAKI